MRKIPYLLVLLVFNFNYVFCKPNKPISKKTTVTLAFDSIERTQSLFLLCKLWGFLKYYHPNIVKGDVDWDEQLIKILPAYTGSHTAADRNTILEKWITDLGSFSTFYSAPDTLNKQIKSQADLTWINKNNFSPEIVKALENIKRNHDFEKQYYVQFNRNEDIRMVAVAHEKAYNNIQPLSKELQLLSVFRYWNIIEYWYPYKYLIKNGWDKCLTQFINEASAIKSENDFFMLMQKMIASIKDSHAILISSKIDLFNGKYQLPLTIKFLEGKAIISSLKSTELKEAGVTVGNILKSVNGITVEELVAKKGPYISASNIASFYREEAKQITRCQDSLVKLVILDNNKKEHSISIKTERYSSFVNTKVYDFSYQRDSSFFMLTKDILYVNIGNLKRDQVSLLKKHFKTVKGIIFDARQYPRNSSGDLISELILPHKVALSKFSSPLRGEPGMFQFSSPVIIGGENPDYFMGKIVTLVNEETQSTGEFLAMSFKLAPNSVIVGSMTAGADGNVMPAFPLPGGIYTQLTALGVYYPDGKETQQVGIVPDIKVNETIKGLTTHTDELLQKAISIILN
jgi:C-terminal processing protease CtpA/Prc